MSADPLDRIYEICQLSPPDALAQIASILGFDELQSDLAASRASCDRYLETLVAIANARPSTWDPEMRDQFQPWAQNIARHSIDQSRQALEPTK